MRSEDELLMRLSGYGAADFIYLPGRGCLAWHFSTGDNLEPLFIEVERKREGIGRELYRLMCRRLIAQGTPPYHSVFAYRRTANFEAREFYAALGFRQLDLGESVYREGGTTLMWTPWADLLKELGL